MIPKDIQDKIEVALHSIDGIKRAEVPPFFYTRLQARLTNQHANTWWQQLFLISTKPTFCVITLSLFILLNITAITTIIKDKKQALTTPESTTIQSFAQEYNLSTTTVYTYK